MDAVNAVTSNWGQGSVALAACPNWNHFPVPEYSIDFVVVRLERLGRRGQRARRLPARRGGHESGQTECQNCEFLHDVSPGVDRGSSTIRKP